MASDISDSFIRPFDILSLDDIGLVGGKNASLGELIQHFRDRDIPVPHGFATTAAAYWHFLQHNELKGPIQEQLDHFERNRKPLEEIGKKIRRLFIRSEFPEDLSEQIRDAYKKLCESHDKKQIDVAVRSSATAEDLPEASFAGQQESYLNIRGADALLESCRLCYASLFTDRAITYRVHQGFDHMSVALSVGVQKMIRSDRGSAGVMFTIDTENGFPDVVVINGSWGLGENIVKGVVTPDEFRVFKPFLHDDSLCPIIEKRKGSKMKKLIYGRKGEDATRQVDVAAKDRSRYVLENDEILTLSRWADTIEQHYGKPMDIEWAKDGKNGDFFILQARPETVQSRKSAKTLKRYRLKSSGRSLVQGAAIGSAIASGAVHILRSVKESAAFPDDAILVAESTDPDWVPVMKRASGIVTDRGGRTSHAAIVSRELAVPAVIGTDNATKALQQEQAVTLSCAEGETGNVYEGILDYEVQDLDLSQLPDTRTKIMLNVANPEIAMSWWNLPCDGVGLARMEFLINNVIKVHPQALLDFEKVTSKTARKAIDELTADYDNKEDYFVDALALGIAKIAASRCPDPVIVRLSDFKTNEYANLLGGAAFEPVEENPMLGFRGASRYYSDSYRRAFGLECQALKKVRQEVGFTNVIAMVPFCRTLEEADNVIAIMKEEGLERGRDGFQLYVMAEIPANIVLAREFAERFDGFSIGSNDLTQLVLGTDRDSDLLRHIFDERNPAVKKMIQELITVAHECGVHVGICGQGPSDHPDFAEFLVDCGIDSLSLSPDSIVDIRQRVAKLESNRGT